MQTRPARGWMGVGVEQYGRALGENESLMHIRKPSLVLSRNKPAVMYETSVRHRGIETHTLCNAAPCFCDEYIAGQPPFCLLEQCKVFDTVAVQAVIGIRNHCLRGLNRVQQ